MFHHADPRARPTRSESGRGRERKGGNECTMKRTFGVNIGIPLRKIKRRKRKFSNLLFAAFCWSIIYLYRTMWPRTMPTSVKRAFDALKWYVASSIATPQTSLPPEGTWRFHLDGSTAVTQFNAEKAEWMHHIAPSSHPLFHFFFSWINELQFFGVFCVWRNLTAPHLALPSWYHNVNVVM